MKIPKLETMIHDLITIVKQDGKISDDERLMMRGIKEKMYLYVQAYQQCLADNVITPAEHKQLENLWLAIYEQPKKVAMLDGIVTREELDILLRVAKTILEE